MTTMLARSAVVGPANPLLVLSAITRGNVVTPDNLARAGTLLDVYDATWRILNTSDPTVDPTVITSGAVDTVADRISTGRYAARWTVPTAEALGEHSIEWTYRFAAGDDPEVVTDKFDVIPAGMRRPGYCTIQDLLDEGYSTDDATMKRMWLAINKASGLVDRLTGRFFEARYNPNFKVDGLGGRMLLLDIPIVALAHMTFDTSPFSPADLPVDSSLFRVYSRHITQGMRSPDDRENPKIELFYSSEDLIGRRAPYSFSSLIFPRGQQNVSLDGIFGYTELDGSTVGGTPQLIRHATMLIAAKELYKLKTGRDEREDGRARPFLVSESTRDQSYQLDAKRNEGLAHGLTGDPEVDQILIQFMRPPSFGGV